MNARALWAMVKSGVQSLLKSEAAHRVAAWLTALIYNVSASVMEKAAESIQGWITEAAEKYPEPGTGTKKWNYVWSKLRACRPDFVSLVGTQAAETLVQNMIATMTRRGEKT